MVVEKGSDKIQQLQRKRQGKSKETSQVDAVLKLSNFGKPALNVFNKYTMMFRTQRFLKKVNYIQVNMDTPLTFPGNDQHQTKSGKFFVKHRDNIYDWYKAYLRVNFTFEALADGANVAGDTRSAPSTALFL